MICKATKGCPIYQNGHCLGIDTNCTAIGTDVEDYLRECFDSYEPNDPYNWL